MCQSKRDSLTHLSGLLLVISSQHEFVFIRVPKTASTTCAFYFLDSGLVSDEDRYSNKTAKRIKSIIRKTDSKEGHRCVEDIEFTKYSHTKHRDIVIDYPEVKDYMSIATVRNPIDRVISAAIMLCQKNITANKLNEYIEFILTGKHIFSVAQHEFVSKDTILWPIENVQEKIEKFILDRGGNMREQWHCRKNNSCDYTNLVSIDLKKQIEAKYSKDFELWEKALTQ